jgi:hypothetical protein
VLEILTFRLGPGVDEATFRGIDARLQVEVCYQQPGFVRRTLGRHDDGRWLVLTIWTNSESAATAARVVDGTEFGRQFAALTTDVVVERFHGVD